LENGLDVEPTTLLEVVELTLKDKSKTVGVGEEVSSVQVA
jgi:hypothetical protein